MEKNENRKNDMPDFDSLDDRIIVEPSNSPRIVAKTNLDVKTNKDENPYATDNVTDDTEQRLFNEFFDES
ncbi:hypothetical protein GH741_17880 [Aquibacillus halophilus]|uniref:Uncharacterized protein n=1 Tax=Aquibacillus halophilus TaxID=930132 RepID=A0A6A8DNA1_9BACI|nr:hypothetical protein [Aquibacillus halophilus]MRH44517.1 hypothetical protein [Aquibacillus halophilus]